MMSCVSSVLPFILQDVIDRACKDKANKEFDADFKLEIFLDKVGFSGLFGMLFMSPLQWFEYYAICAAGRGNGQCGYRRRSRGRRARRGR